MPVATRRTRLALTVLLALVAMLSSQAALAAGAAMTTTTAPSTAPAVGAAGGPRAEYRGPAGVRIVSYSAGWTSQAQLKEVYDELLRNFHGEELSLLDAVELHPEQDQASGAAGYWEGSWTIGYEAGPRMEPGRRIILYDIDRRTQVREIATALSHEYGHHFTYYYLAKREGVLFDDGWSRTAWARTRGLLDYPEVSDGSHQWNPAEIAANDYVLLFGSPLAHEVAFAGVSTYYPSSGTTIWDPAPQLQENRALPLATEMPGLREYWLGAMGPTAGGQPAITPSPALRLRSFDPSGRATLEWAPAAGAPEGSQYALWWDNVPDPSARVPRLGYTGSGIPKDLAARTHGFDSVLDFTDPFKGNTTGWARLFVVTLGHGMINRSNLLWFKRGSDGLWRLYRADPYHSTPAALLWDLPPGHWAEKDVLALSARGAVGGFPDGSFRPNDPLTRAQFTKLLVAALGRAPEPGTGGYLQLARLGGHWLATAGWLVPAVKAGLLLPDEWGPVPSVDIDAPVPRQEMARMAVRALGLKPGATAGASAFVDAAQIPTEFAGYVATAYQHGILLGFPAGGDGKVAFHPLEGTTRAQGAVVVNRLLAKTAATSR